VTGRPPRPEGDALPTPTGHPRTPGSANGRHSVDERIGGPAAGHDAAEVHADTSSGTPAAAPPLGWQAVDNWLGTTTSVRGPALGAGRQTVSGRSSAPPPAAAVGWQAVDDWATGAAPLLVPETAPAPTNGRVAVDEQIAGPAPLDAPAPAAVPGGDGSGSPTRVNALLRYVAWGLLLPAALLVTWAYSLAARASTDGDQLHFHVFWLGVLLFLIPASAYLLFGRPAAAERIAVIVAVGLLATLPKILLSPTSPIFHDEYAHWRQAVLVRQSGALFIDNPVIHVIKYFPGLHAVTAFLGDISGIHSFTVAQVLIASVHVASLLGIYVLADAVTGSPRVASIAALIYALNPSYMYFDAQFAYESYAIVLLIWVLACAARIERARTAGERAAWVVTGVLIGLTCVVTHHLTSFILLQMLVCVTAVACVRALMHRTRTATPMPRILPALTALAACFAIAASAWLIFVAPAAVDYLWGGARPGFTQLLSILRHSSHSRTLFQHTTSPPYERIAAFASPFLAFAGVLVAVYALRRRSWQSSVGIGVAAYGLLYFASLPLILTAGGAEGAGRMWSFTYIGIALLLASAVTWLVDTVHSRGKTIALRCAVVTALGILAVGNVAMFTSPDYRFPGPFIYGADTRSVTPELKALGATFDRVNGQGNYVVTDRSVGLVMAGLYNDWTASASDGFPTWQLFFDPNGPSPELVRELEGSGWQYLIVDRRMYSSLPLDGIYLESGEPTTYGAPPRLAYTRLFTRSWLIPVLQTTNYTVFRFNFSGLAH
jgi:hypothetical protein